MIVRLVIYTQIARYAKISHVDFQDTLTNLSLYLNEAQ
jgi:hypothetical protein